MLQAFSLRLFLSLVHFNQTWVSLLIDRVLIIWIVSMLSFFPSFIAGAKTEICSLESSRYQEGFERGKEATAWSTFRWRRSLCSFKCTYYHCKCMVQSLTLFYLLTYILWNYIDAYYENVILFVKFTFLHIWSRITIQKSTYLDVCLYRTQVQQSPSSSELNRYQIRYLRFMIWLMMIM